MRPEIVGFEFHSYGEELVRQILVRYLAGASLEKLALQLEGVTFAQAQRIVNEAVARGVLLPEEKHPPRCPATKLERAKQTLINHPNHKIGLLAQLADCSESTLWRAKAKIANDFVR